MRGIVSKRTSLLGCCIPVHLHVESSRVFSVPLDFLFYTYDFPSLSLLFFFFLFLLSFSPQMSYYQSLIFLESFTSYDLLSFLSNSSLAKRWLTFYSADLSPPIRNAFYSLFIIDHLREHIVQFFHLLNLFLHYSV